MAEQVSSAYRWWGRFIGTAIAFYSAYLLIITVANLISGTDYDSALIVAWILGAAVIGLLGSLVFLFSLDGPIRFMTPAYRRLGWWAMFLAILLPTAISFVLGPLAATTIGLSFQRPRPPGRHVKMR